MSFNLGGGGGKKVCFDVADKYFLQDLSLLNFKTSSLLIYTSFQIYL